MCYQLALTSAAGMQVVAKVHRTGCQCKNSHCLKGYCECFKVSLSAPSAQGLPPQTTPGALRPHPHAWCPAGRGAMWQGLQVCVLQEHRPESSAKTAVLTGETHCTCTYAPDACTAYATEPLSAVQCRLRCSQVYASSPSSRAATQHGGSAAATSAAPSSVGLVQHLPPQ